jgi:hypothetical protein
MSISARLGKKKLTRFYFNRKSWGWWCVPVIAAMKGNLK